MKAHVLVNLPEEYKHVRMNLYMNANYTHKQYKMNIKHYWYTDLGGKEHLQTGRSECDNVIKKNQSLEELFSPQKQQQLNYLQLQLLIQVIFSVLEQSLHVFQLVTLHFHSTLVNFRDLLTEQSITCLWENEWIIVHKKYR